MSQTKNKPIELQLVENLARKQKEHLISKINSGSNEEPYIKKISPGFRKVIEKISEHPQGKWLAEQYQNNTYVLTLPTNKKGVSSLIFFKNKNDLIVYIYSNKHLFPQLRRKQDEAQKVKQQK